MKTALRLEFIGASAWDALRQFESLERMAGIGRCDRKSRPFDRPGPCVLRCYKADDGEIRHEIVHGKRDYSRANSKGTRGVYLNYILEEDELYLVKSPDSWRSTSVYFAAVDTGGKVVKVTNEDALEWLNAL